MEKVLSLLPSTRQMITTKLGETPDSTARIVREVIKQGYAEEWGSEVTGKGTLAPIIWRTEKPLPKD